jgi:hypothetical protein
MKKGVRYLRKPAPLPQKLTVSKDVTKM